MTITLRDIANQFVTDAETSSRHGQIAPESLNMAAAAETVDRTLANAILRAYTEWENSETSAASDDRLVRAVEAALAD